VNRLHVLLACVLLAGAGVAAPALADVPDARLVVSDVTVAPEAPEPGNTTTVEFTVENSAGSATGVALDRVALRERGTETVYAEAEGLGSLSVGDDVTLELATAFNETGVTELELLVEASDEADDDGESETVTVTRPVTVVVGGVDAAGITDDVQVTPEPSTPRTRRGRTARRRSSAPVPAGCWAAGTTEGDGGNAGRR